MAVSLKENNWFSLRIKLHAKVTNLELLGVEEEWHRDEQEAGSADQEPTPPHPDPVAIRRIWKKRRSYDQS
jgi:hypothetical protein